jgi:uncharacterized protein (TIGR02246 family)
MAVVALVAGACGREESTDSTVQPQVATSIRPSTTTVDPFMEETNRIIQDWIEAWMAKDIDGVADLYAEDGTYADVGCPFEMNGKSAIRGMVSGHVQSATYTVVDPVEISYTDSGAVVQWIWGGTYNGELFTMEPSTTFEIEDGVIVRSTDSYNRSDAPSAWEGDCIEYAGG